MSRIKHLSVISVLLVVSITLGGWLVNATGISEPDIYVTLKKNLTLFQTIYREITFRYVDALDPEAFIKAGIQGMTQKLDPYTSLIERDEGDNLQMITRGKYGGVGMTISRRGDYPTVVEPPFDGTPAAKAGIREGDQIIEVDGKSTKGESINDVALRLRGQKGTTVRIKIRRASEENPLEFRLVRDIITIQDIRYADILQDSIGYIQLTRFSKNSAEQLRSAILDLKRKGANSLILDLRSNPGGLLDAAVRVADLFVPRGELIVYTKGRMEQANRKYFAMEEPIWKDGKLVVLVNGISASASEIVAGAIQDLDLGLIIGSRTYGKGLVQTLIPLPGQPIGLRITTAKYYIPSGRLIQDLSRLNRDESILLKEDEELATKNQQKKDKPVYHTKKGRVVYGGGGIQPDVEVEQPPLTNYEIALIRQSMFFNFAVDYAGKIERSVHSIEITDQIIEEFRAFLQENHFTYQAEGEEDLARLEKLFNDQDYGPSFSEHVTALRKQIEEKKEEEFSKHLPFIKRMLKVELAAKVLGSRAEVEAGFEYDKPLQTAIEVLTKPGQYLAKMGN